MHLVILDPSLGDPRRGHPRHAQHAADLARAVIAGGGTAIIAAHRDCQPAAVGLADLTVERVFPESVYWRWDHTEVPFQPSRLTLTRAEIDAHVQRFSDACAALLDRIGVEPNQLHYLPMVSELHVQGLAQLIERRADARQASWHAQFHFQFLHGEPSGYDAQAERSATMREVLADALAGAAASRIFLYATNDGLTEQFQRLGVAEVCTLPQTASAQHTPSAAPRRRPRPLRLTVAGALRPTKMWAYEAMVAALQPRLRSGDVQLVVQVPSAHPMCPERPDAWRTATGPLSCTPFPLPPDEYAALVRQTHVALLPYDPAVYYARSSAILADMLSAGVPLIIPARWSLTRSVPVVARAPWRSFDGLDQLGPALDALIDDWLAYKLAAIETAAAYRASNAPERVLQVLMARSASAVR
jgi:hypothetical protein